MNSLSVTSYSDLKHRFAQIRHLEDAGDILESDMTTVMPSGSSNDRTNQIVTLTRIRHEKLTDPHIQDLISDVKESMEGLTDWDIANVNAMQRMYIHASAVPEKLAAEQARLSSVGNQKHSYWLESNDWEDHRRHLESILPVRQEVANLKQAALGSATAYDALIDEYDPYSTADRIDALFAPVEEFLKESIPIVTDQSEVKALTGDYPLAGQEKLYRRIISDMGFDFDRGKLFMINQHPSCGGTPDDVRFTTRCNESEFIEGLRAVVHETGHALYEQNLPIKWRYQPVGDSLGMTIHESQSLFWEVQVANHAGFFDYISPLVRDAFGLASDDKDHMPHSLLACGNSVRPGLIRIEADEMTYPMHVFLRFDLEKKLIGGELEVKDIPEAWNSGMVERLGMCPSSYSDGCIQDIHWSQGAFGYFPCYTLGAMAAAQFHSYLVKAIPDFEKNVTQGNFRPILDWLVTNIHEQAFLYKPMELIERACGEPLNPQYFIAHLQSRFGAHEDQGPSYGVK